MKANVLNLEGSKVKEIELPRQFNEEYNLDIIKRAVLAIHSHNRQKYGANPRAGKDYSAKLSKRRREYRGSYGHGISRIPRKIMSRRGRHFNWVGAVIPGTRGGRKAHPPKAEKKWELKINNKERRKAIRSAIAASVNIELVKKRGHLFDKVPLIVEDKLYDLKKTKDVLKTLKKLGLEKELERSSKKNVRAGKGKSRGRKYRKKKGVLIVVGYSCDLEKTGINIPGIDICIVDKLNVELLAPGCDAGRLTLWCEGSINRLKEERLFLK